GDGSCHRVIEGEVEGVAGLGPVEPDEPDRPVVDLFDDDRRGIVGTQCRHGRMTWPPSTLKTCPVTHRASSDSRNRHIPTRSSGVPCRLRASDPTSWRMYSSGTTDRAASVSVGPGAMALTRMFIPPSSWASC